MPRSFLGIVLVALAACSSRSAPETIPGPALGESTADLPTNSSRPNPDAAEPGQVSSRLSPAAAQGAFGAPAPAAPAAPATAGGAAAAVPSEVGGAAAIDPGTPIANDAGVGPRDAGVAPSDGGTRPGVSDAGSLVSDGGPRPGLSDASVPR
jgi:hypothetical protein